MRQSDERPNSQTAHAGHFVTTHWSLVLAAGDCQSPQAAAALEKLCRAYWYPLYAYIRRRGYGSHDAQDLTQSFFAELLTKNFIRKAAREHGRFRSFLLASLNNLLADEADKARAQKRGGGITIISLDAQDAEERYCLEPSHGLTPEKIYERRWAMTLLHQVLAQLQNEFTADGKQRLFDQLKGFLLGDSSETSCAEVAARLDMTEGAVKVAVHRLRRRFRELFRAEISQTVAMPGEVDDEMRHLFAALGS